MALLLIDPDCDLLIALDATSGLLDSLKEQWSRLQHDPERESFGTRLSGRILPILADCLDWDLKPPQTPRSALLYLLPRSFSSKSLPGFSSVEAIWPSSWICTARCYSLGRNPGGVRHPASDRAGSAVPICAYTLEPDTA